MRICTVAFQGSLLAVILMSRCPRRERRRSPRASIDIFGGRAGRGARELSLSEDLSISMNVESRLRSRSRARWARVFAV
jgi:hypothetical protein